MYYYTVLQVIYVVVLLFIEQTNGLNQFFLTSCFSFLQELHKKMHS